VRRASWTATAILTFFLAQGHASAQSPALRDHERPTFHLGAGLIRPSEPDINAMADFYFDAAGPNSQRVTWRAGVNYQYGMSDETIGSTVTYNGVNLRVSAMVSPNAVVGRRGVYFGGGPSLIYRHLNTNIWGSGGGGVTFNCAGTSGSQRLWCGMLNDYSGPATPDENIVNSAWKVGGHAFAGYSRSIWHVEVLYEKGASDIVDLGGLSFRFGLSF
jgi:hypothetical protein